MPISKDVLVLAPLDIKTDTMTPNFTTIEMKDLKNGEMIYFKHGLKVADLKDSETLRIEEQKNKQ